MTETTQPNPTASVNEQDQSATSFTPLLTTTNWNEEWKRLQDKRAHADSADFWDARAKTFPTAHGSHSNYVSGFLKNIDIHPGETVLDMGCGTGALAAPLAEAGHHVIAADFSQGMLDAMMADFATHGTKNVTPLHMSWDDNWEACGVGPRSVDVALGSRSIATRDLADALMKLDRVARRRVCISLPCGSSPRVDERLMSAVGLQNQLGRDFVYAFNILVGLGKKPEVTYLPSSRYETFDNFTDAETKLSAVIRNAAEGFARDDEIEAALVRLHDWLSDQLVENERAGEVDHHGVVERRYRLKRARVITWVFMAWEK